MPNSLTDLDTYNKALEGLGIVTGINKDNYNKVLKGIDTTGKAIEGLGIATGVTGQTPQGSNRAEHIVSSFAKGGQNVLSGGLVGLNELGSDVTGLLGMEALQAKYDLLTAQRRGEISPNSAAGAIGEELGYGGGIGAGIKGVGGALNLGADIAGNAWRRSLQAGRANPGTVDNARRMINQGTALATISPKAAISAFGKGTNDALTLGIGDIGMGNLLSKAVGGTSRASRGLAAARMARMQEIAGGEKADILNKVIKSAYVDHPANSIKKKIKVAKKLRNKEYSGVGGIKEVVKDFNQSAFRQLN